MEIVRQKLTPLWRVMIFAVILMLGTFVLPDKSEAQSIIFEPTTEYLHVNSPIVLEFDGQVMWNPTFYTSAPTTPAINQPGIRLVELSTGRQVEISFRLDATGKKLVITPNPSPTNPIAVKWEKNKDYKLEIMNHIIVESPGSGLFLPLSAGNPPLTYNISTFHLTFQALMTGSREINQIIQDYTPRKIQVKAADRYIDEVSIIHKRQDLVQNSTMESVTNIDITFDNKAIDNPNGDVKMMEVIPKRNGRALQTAKIIDNINITPNVGKKMFDFAFTKLPDTSAFDIEVILYDSNGIVIDKRVVKVPLESNNTTTIKQKDRYRFAGRTFTLYDLMNKPKDLQTLLTENQMDEIKVWVVQQ